MCKKNNYIQVSATVQSQTCNLSCNTTVTYVVNGVTLTGNVVLNEVLNQGGMVDIFYDQNNPSNLSSTSKNTFISGLVLTLFSLVLIGASIANYYMTSKSKIYSAVEGAQTIVNLI